MTAESLHRVLDQSLDVPIIEQKRTLRALRVGPIVDFIGPALEETIEDTFSRPRKCSSDRAYTLCMILSPEGHLGRNQSVRQIGEDMLARRTHAGNITTLEIFNLQNFRAERAQIALPYSNFIATDEKTGSSADVAEIWNNIYLLPRSEQNNAFYQIREETVLIQECSNIPPDINHLAALLHEIGHHFQFSHYKTHELRAVVYGSMLKAFFMPHKHTQYMIDQERNAWAFALSVARNYRELGVDFTSQVTRHMANIALHYHDRFKPQRYNNLRYNKARVINTTV